MIRSQTILTLEGVGFPPCSARGCVQKLYLLGAKEAFRRTVNGQLLYIGDAEHEKWGSTIRCQDDAMAALGAIRCGDVLQVGCIVTLTQTVNSLKQALISLNRPAVQDAIVLYDATNKPVPFKVEDPQKVVMTLEENSVYAEPVFLSYRPYLRMMVQKMHYDVDEWGMKTSWFLEMAEV